jgi:hypothetical protein
VRVLVAKLPSILASCQILAAPELRPDLANALGRAHGFPSYESRRRSQDGSDGQGLPGNVIKYKDLQDLMTNLDERVVKIAEAKVQVLKPKP